jgi:hypothetical protein
MFNRSTRTAPALRLEELEARDVPAIAIQFDYSHDTSGFFNNVGARAELEEVGRELGGMLTTNLSAITPSGSNTWSASFYDPASGQTTSVPNLSIGANTIVVYVGARALGSSEAGFGGPGGFSASGTTSWIDTVQHRGHPSGFAPWGGSITFDTTQNWYFGSSAAALPSNRLDFFSVASHELGHVLGLGTAPQWQSQVSGGTFHGGNAMAVYGGPVPVSSGGDHWAPGVTVNGHQASLDPSLPYGVRVPFSALDVAGLADLGWNTADAAPAPRPSPVPAGVTIVSLLGNNGVVTQYAYVNGVTFATGARFVPIPGYHGSLLAAYGDFDGDGVIDVAVATTGGNGPSLIVIVSGLDGHYIGARAVPGGVKALIALDVHGDGNTELVTLEGNKQLGIFVYDVTPLAIVPDAHFTAFGTPGRAALTADGNLDRSGYDDVITNNAAQAPSPIDFSEGTNHDVPQPQTTKPSTTPAPLVGTNSSAPQSWDDDLLPMIHVP